MRFDSDHKVIIDSMTLDECKAFVKFLISEMMRHEEDIDNAATLVCEVYYRIKKMEE